VADGGVNRSFYVHIQAELKARDWSARELARRADCSVSTFTRIKQGHGIALAIAARIADVLGKPLSELLTQVKCEACRDMPPPGFTCNACGAQARAD
jgi:transcriptional regulator with XRE-family HTH domain